MTEPSRMIILDNKDNRLIYSKDWQSLEGQELDDLEGATPYKNSLHETRADGADLRFSFKGSYARIMGTYDLVGSTSASEPNWECTLDGNTVQRERVERSNVGGRRLTLCAFLNLPGGDHTIGLTTKTQGSNIYIDYVEYRTMAPVMNEVIWASSGDPDLRYSGQWTPPNVDPYTMNKGSSATLRFIGTGVTLQAAYSAELPHANGEASYSVDGGPSTTFIIYGGGNTSVRNRRILEVNGLNKQVHAIEITYISNGDTTPLAISNFFIENGTNVRVSSDPLLSPPSASTGEIIGGVLGGIAVVSLLLWATWKYRRYWMRRWFSRHGEGSAIHPSSTNQGQQEYEMSTIPTTLLPNRPSALSSARDPTRHSTTSSETRSASTQSMSASVSPYPEAVYTGRYPHSRHTEHRIQHPSNLRISDIIVG